MKYLFLDTNVYLHYMDFEQIDWKELIDSDFTIVVPPIVIREIDKHKDNNRGKIQSKAKAVSKKFGDIFLRNIPSKYDVTDCLDPQAEHFDGKRFNMAVNDDWFILSALDSNFENTDIIIVSGDVNLLIKAKQGGLSFFQMPDKLLLRVEETDAEKECRRLRMEIEDYKNSRSHAIITFQNETNAIQYTRPKERNIDEELKEYLIQLKNEYPYKPTDNYKKPEDFIIRGKTIPFITSSMFYDDNPEHYNEALDDFFKKKEDYQRFLIEKEVMDERFVPINLSLVNIGNSQTGDVNIFVDIPDNIKIYNKKSVKCIFEQEITPPVPGLIGCNYDLNIYPYGQPSIRCWDIEKPQSDHRLRFFISNLNHQLKRALEYSPIYYIDIGTCPNFQMHWSCTDSKRPGKTEGDLFVTILEKK